MIHKALITVLALLSIGVPAGAQTNGKWAVDMGERVRLKTIGAPDLWLDGNVIALDGDTLWLAQRQGGERLAIPAPSIRQLEVSRGRRSNFVRGLGIGLAGGAVLGAAMGLIDGDDPPCPAEAWFCFRYSAGEKAVAGALVGGGLGGHSWAELWEPRPDRSVGPPYGRQIFI
jgi:hypothetical protein